MRVLLIDNYDSFVHNLAQYVGALGAEPVVLRNDVGLEEMHAVQPDAILISPGPGHPDEAGLSVKVLESWDHATPILGVCLGHQAIGVAFGAKVVRAEKVMHGKTSVVEHDGKGLFRGVPSPLIATRYHSLVIDPGSLPDELAVTATTSDGQIMGVRHRTRPVEGIQFHPESITTEHGMKLIQNLVAL